MTDNETLAKRVIEEAESRGVREFCVCPGARNSALFFALKEAVHLKKYYWPEERSAAFFALGRSRESGSPVAVVTTSGTAVGELLPATMEAYYTGTPLLLITADRPRRFRGTGAPQAAEQVGIFGVYTPFACDIAYDEPYSLESWNRCAPAHLNVCFEDPFATQEYVSQTDSSFETISTFLSQARYPLVIVSALPQDVRAAVAAFLLRLNAPLFLEGVSGLREHKELSHLRINRVEKLLAHARQSGHEVDAVLRIGGIPTFRLWRDLEEMQGKIAVASVSDLPFSGLSWNSVSCTPIQALLKHDHPTRELSATAHKWLATDRTYSQRLHSLFHEEPQAEPSLVYQLSRKIPSHSHVYLGNSLPIREWDLAACPEERGFHVTASRGLNGIDGQIATFLGLSKPGMQNWALLGDLTTLYDMAGPWILPQTPDLAINIVVINNSGGKIFQRLFKDEDFLNAHGLSFEPLARMWGLHYERWESIPDTITPHSRRLIELVPNDAATQRFWSVMDHV